MSRKRLGQGSPFRRATTPRTDHPRPDWLQEDAPRIRKRSLAPGEPIRPGMMGSGRDAFIGAVHCHASRLDGRYVLIAGALSSTPDRSRESGRTLGPPPDRCYGTFEEMTDREARRFDGIHAVSIVTPNHMHFAAAKPFLERGIHVICDKPLAVTLAEAEASAAAAVREPAPEPMPSAGFSPAIPRGIWKASPTSIPAQRTRFSLMSTADACQRKPLFRRGSKTAWQACDSSRHG